jgi:hypothetical protein
MARSVSGEPVLHVSRCRLSIPLAHQDPPGAGEIIIVGGDGRQG